MRWIVGFRNWLFLRRLRYPRFTLKRWLELDSLKSDVLDKAVSERDASKVAEAICLYLSMALGNSEEFWLSQPWKVVMEHFFGCELVNQPTRKIPMLMGNVKKEAPMDWDYSGRTWMLWADIFSSEYGWSLEATASLDIDDATGLMQEILVRRQLEREFDWMRSEVAYPYNSQTKKSEFKKIPRPFFMLPSKETIVIPILKIRKDHLPVGNIVTWEDLEQRKN